VPGLTAALTAFAIVLVAELPDKTALASLVLGTRYRPRPALVGIAAGFTVHVLLAVLAGSLLRLLPQHILKIVVGVLFAGSGLVLLIRRPSAEEESAPEREARGFWAIAATSFVVILVAEFGDLTQLVIANLVARYADPIAVGVGAVVAMWTVATAAVFGGRNLLRLVPATLLTRVAGAIMLALAGLSLATAFS
jgi:putative Ca2+/H+ antiporter (TMEM165/GDT1 family)